MKKNIFLKIILFISICIIMYIIYKVNNVCKTSAENINEYINSFGKWNFIIYILLFIIKSIFIVLPNSILIIIGAVIFAPIENITYSLTGTVLASNFAFFVSRSFNKKFLKKSLSKFLLLYGKQMKEQGLKIIFFLRISPITNFDILSYAAGFSEIKYKDFLIGTIGGMLLKIIFLTYITNKIF